MAEIHILDSGTVDKIAAGEVVERPSSVVKELVENAVDAGATAVTVEARDGGIEFVRVTDNGCGMRGDQLPTAFLRHATSKIGDASDLLRLRSLGFRGEALSSIAAVSKVEIVTKTAEGVTGSRYLLEGGREIAFEEVGAPDGTTFVMRNLFYNTPARRKFLKQPATEGGYIADLMEHLALSRPDISFKLVIGSQLRFHTSGNGDLKEVIYRIYGRDAARELVPVQAEKDGVRVEGYLGKPVQVRSNRNFEIYFINGRFIRSTVVARALEEGYREYLMQHKFPFCVLHISMDTSLVDVNVHPSKMDVRLGDAMGFGDFLTETVRETLRGREMMPEALLSTGREQRKAFAEEKRERERERTPEPFERKRADVYRVREEAVYRASRPGGGSPRREFSESPAWEQKKDELLPGGRADGKKTLSEEGRSAEEFFTETSELAEDESSEGANTAASLPKTLPPLEKAMSFAERTLPPSEKALPSAEKTLPPPEKALPLTEGAENGENDRKEAASSTEGALPGPETASPQQLNLFEEKILTADNRSRFRVVGQVFETYWLIEFEDRLLMVDQHAAHEKVNYERLMGQFRRKSVASQRLMPPLIVSLSGQEEAVLREHLEVFEGLGFEIEAFGGSEYALRSVPTDLYGCNEREMFLEVLDQLASGVSFGGIRAIEEKIASMSCKAAVKGNSRLSVPEVQALMDELLTLDNPYNCPHGRPTIVAMTKAEMDRKFKRIVG